MSESEAFRLLAPAWLMLLPLAWGLCWLYARRHRSRSSWHDWCDAKLLDRLETSGSDFASRRPVAWLLALLATLAILAASGPSWREQEQPVMQTLSARVLVFEMSRSTLVEDLRPNRYARLLAAARELLHEEFEGETGLVVYAGAAFIVAPLTSDTRTLLAFLDALHPETMPVDGARVDLALAAARELLDASMAGRGQVFVFTDGVDDVDSAAAAVLAAADAGHRVSWIAAGTDAGAPLKDRAGNLARDGEGRFRLERTDFARLERIARLGGGALLRLDARGSVADLAGQASAARASVEEELAEPVAQSAANEGYWLVWLALPLVLLLFRRNVLWTLVILCWLPGIEDARADGWDDWLEHSERRAHAAYQRGDFQVAFDRSRDAIRKGSACYRLQRYTCAIEYFEQLDTARAQYNLGNAHAQMQQFPEALVAYARALTLDPALEEARVNQGLLEAWLREQNAGTEGESDDGDSEESSDATSLGNAQARIGLAGELMPNPGDSLQSAAGLGASDQTGALDPEDPYDGSEQGLEEFILRSAGNRDAPDPALVERWLRSLPESSTELFRRKFLRDYQRQIRQDR